MDNKPNKNINKKKFSCNISFNNKKNEIKK